MVVRFPAAFVHVLVAALMCGSPPTIPLANRVLPCAGCSRPTPFTADVLRSCLPLSAPVATRPTARLQAEAAQCVVVSAALIPLATGVGATGPIGSSPQADERPAGSELASASSGRGPPSRPLGGR
jgi:hypothetical protein